MQCQGSFQCWFASAVAGVDLQLSAAGGPEHDVTECPGKGL
jgi:hypothetical protein